MDFLKAMLSKSEPAQAKDSSQTSAVNAEPRENFAEPHGTTAAPPSPTDESRAVELTRQFNEELMKVKAAAALELALTKAGAYDVRTVLPLIDPEKISFSGGEIAGLESEVLRVKSEAAYLFPCSEAKATAFLGGSHSSPPDTGSKTLSEALGEYYRQY